MDSVLWLAWLVMWSWVVDMVVRCGEGVARAFLETATESRQEVSQQ
jgi:hypothetical protein